MTNDIGTYGPCFTNKKVSPEHEDLLDQICTIVPEESPKVKYHYESMIELLEGETYATKLDLS